MLNEMDHGEFVTVKQFASLAGVSVQAVYKRVESIPNELIKVENRKKLISIAALVYFQKDGEPSERSRLKELVESSFNDSTGRMDVLEQENERLNRENEDLKVENNWLNHEIDYLKKQKAALEHDKALLESSYRESLTVIQELNQRIKEINILHLNTQKILDRVTSEPIKLTFTERIKRFFQGNGDRGNDESPGID